jgi:CBS domain-containing protein
VRVIDVMTTDVVTVVPGDSLKDAARKMVNNRVSGLPVVSDGRLAGMVTEADFLK